MDFEKIPPENHDLAKRCMQLMDVFSSRVLSTVQVVLTSQDELSVKLRELARDSPDKFMVRAIEQVLKELEFLLQEA